MGEDYSRRGFIANSLRIAAGLNLAPETALRALENIGSQNASSVDSVANSDEVHIPKSGYDARMDISGKIALEKGLKELGGEEVDDNDKVTLLYYSTVIEGEDKCHGIHIFVNGVRREDVLESVDTNQNDIEKRIVRNDKYQITYGWVTENGNKKAIIFGKSSYAGEMDFSSIDPKKKMVDGQRYYEIALKLLGVNVKGTE
ncbi:MAG: hypothetical protein U9O94_00630 [Nanoarchaeota archaeon]|nr:hypothetical protein [Nanoarchaeota archaeon]